MVLLGRMYGGKTSLVERFIHQRFNESIPYQNTIGAAFGAKSLTIDGVPVTLGIWDTAGSERYEAMSRIYYRGAKAAVVCYDLTDDLSWDKARFWVQEVLAHEQECRIYLAGTKFDLLEQKERPIDYHDTQDYAMTINAKLFETSARTGENIDELFQQIAVDFVGDNRATEYPDSSPSNTDTIDLGNTSQRRSGCIGCSALPWNWKNS